MFITESATSKYTQPQNQAPKHSTSAASFFPSFSSPASGHAPPSRGLFPGLEPRARRASPGSPSLPQPVLYQAQSLEETRAVKLTVMAFWAVYAIRAGSWSNRQWRNWLMKGLPTSGSARSDVEGRR